MLEVLVALVLFGLAVTVLASAYLNIVQSLESVKPDHAFEQEVCWIRAQVMTEPDLKVLLKGGNFETLDFGPARWQADVTAGNIADLFTVVLRIEFGDHARAPRTREESFSVLRPSWTEPLEKQKLRADAKKRLAEDRRHRGVLPTSSSR
jgi:general secretion pathway protein I